MPWLIPACMQAADALRVTGIGRNEYIQIMNSCKGKKLLWRVNRAVAKEYLPTAPQEIKMEVWWSVSVVNVGERLACGACSTPALLQRP